MNTETIRHRIAVRAYFLSLAGAPGGDVAHWLKAEAIELALAERRAAAGSKAARTRRAKAAASAPAEMLVAVTATKHRKALSRTTAH